MLSILSVSVVGFVLGQQGDSCAVTCGRLGKSCIPKVTTDDSTKIFASVGVNCTKQSREGGDWWAPDQPSFVSSSSDPNSGECLGFKHVPKHSPCESHYWSTRRVCNCGGDNTERSHFGTGLSGINLPANETTVFEHNVPAGSFGVMNHFWSTCTKDCIEASRIRYYVDYQSEPSIDYNPILAIGVGFNDSSIAPWGTKWIGTGSDKAYFHNFKIPFSKNIRITMTSTTGRNMPHYYIIVRGVLNAKIEIGGITIPPTANLLLQKIEATVQPLEWVNITNIPYGKGLHFASSLVVKSGNLNFLEGCYHSYTPYTEDFPGTLLSTGTEDYFDSAWYFNSGRFTMPVSGMTHLNQSEGVTWSAYRFHEMDPLTFVDGLRVVWRNGDVIDPISKTKCYTETGIKVGNPTIGEIISYSWVYVW